MSTASIIQQYYNAFYGRPADPSGLAFWVAGVNNSGDLIGAALKVFGSAGTPEFALRYPAGTSVSTFLDTAYGNMFNRTPDADGKRFWEAAFTNWVGSGKSEGEARALILQNFVDSANAQVGTADKLTITNKLTVADAMTASVRQYRTEASFVNALDRAQDLLANVGHTQASVDVALSRIKFGLVDGIDPGPGTPDLPPNIITAPQELASVTGEITLSKATKDIVKITSPSDSPFASKPVAGSTVVYVRAGISLVEFSLQADKIDLSALHLQYSDTASVVKNTHFSIEDFFPSLTVQPVFKNTHTGFFNEKPIIISSWTSPSAGASIYVFVDVNNDRNLDNNDVMITLPGIASTMASDALFIL